MPDFKAIAQAFRAAGDLLGQYADPNASQIARLKADADRYETQKLTKLQMREINQFQSAICLQLQDQAFAGRLLPGCDVDGTIKEITRVFGSINRALYASPPPEPELDISDFAEAQDVKHLSVKCEGDRARLGPIVKKAIALMKRFSKAIARDDLKGAYEMTGAVLQQRMSLQDFVKAHVQSYKKYGGPPVKFQIDLFAYVLADEAARLKSPDRGWPKGTPKDTRRCRVLGDWLLDLKTGSMSCRASYWITEEEKKFRIVDFNFYFD